MKESDKHAIFGSLGIILGFALFAATLQSPTGFLKWTWGRFFLQVLYNIIPIGAIYFVGYARGQSDYKLEQKERAR